MRDIAEKCRSFTEAECEIMSMPAGMPFCIGLSDAKNGKAAVFERDREMKIKKRDIIDGILTADNNLWCGVKMAGQCSIDDQARKIRPKKINTMKTVLRDKKVMMACNIYSVIFDYPSNCFYLACGEIPAAEGEYQKYKLFENQLLRTNSNGVFISFRPSQPVL